MPAERKLSDDDVKQIRRRVSRGESITDLAREFGVNRKTIRRRIDALKQEEAEEAERLAAPRRRRQAAGERRKLLERERGPSPKRGPGRPKRDPPSDDPGREAGMGVHATYSSRRDPRLDWLDRRKNLSGRAFAEARGLVRLRNPDGTIEAWFERAQVDDLLDEGWTLA